MLPQFERVCLYLKFGCAYSLVHLPDNAAISGENVQFQCTVLLNVINISYLAKLFGLSCYSLLLGMKIFVAFNILTDHTGYRKQMTEMIQMSEAGIHHHHECGIMKGIELTDVPASTPCNTRSRKLN